MAWKCLWFLICDIQYHHILQLFRMEHVNSITSMTQRHAIPIMSEAVLRTGIYTIMTNVKIPDELFPLSYFWACCQWIGNWIAVREVCMWIVTNILQHCRMWTEMWLCIEKIKADGPNFFILLAIMTLGMSFSLNLLISAF